MKGRYLAAVLTALLLCAGCKEVNKKPEITVAMWAMDVYSDYMEQVEKLVPDVKIKWVKAQSNLGYYKELAGKGKMPDILSVRRFSLRDSLDLNQYLMELSGTEVTSAFYDMYLESYRTDDRKVFWIPMSGTVDGIAANKALFEKYQIPIPQDFDSFISACREFESHGIRGYSLDMSQDYNALHLLQGFGIESLASVDGSIWRKAYDSGITDKLDRQVWLPAFWRMQVLNEAGIITKETMDEDDLLSYQRLKDGKQAMVNISSESISKMFPESDMEVLPYFGESEDFLMTYPVFHLAVNRQVEEDPEKREAAWSVLMAMASPEAQKILNDYTDGLIPYRRDVEFDYAECMRMVQPYLEDNQTYIRLGAEEIFSASQKTVDKMLSTGMKAREAFEWMDRYLEESHKKDR